MSSSTDSFFFWGGGGCARPVLTATMKNSQNMLKNFLRTPSGRPKAFLENALRTSSVSDKCREGGEWRTDKNTDTHKGPLLRQIPLVT